MKGKAPKSFKEYVAALMDKKLELKMIQNAVCAVPASKTQELMASIVCNAQGVIDGLSKNFEDAYMAAVGKEGMDKLWADASDKLAEVDKDAE